jgi:predicted phosphodiesterase
MRTRRYLVLSDIHSNFAALWAVIRASFRTFRPHVVVVAGDIVGYGPDPSLVVRTLRRSVELLGATLVAVDGNHDREARDKEAPRQMHADAAECLVLNRRAMTSSDVAFLRRLPEWVRVGPFTVAHDPAGNHGYVIHPEDALEALQAIRTPHAIVGHTHWPGFFEARGAGVDDVSTFTTFEEGDEVTLANASRYVLNPGSVGQPRDGDPRASYLEVTEAADGTVTVRARRAAYDLATTQIRMLLRGYPVEMAVRLSAGQ